MQERQDDAVKVVLELIRASEEADIERCRELFTGEVRGAATTVGRDLLIRRMG